MDKTERSIRPCAPIALRPLLGETVLLVEDSRFASEAIRLLCQRAGARLRRADNVANAWRHLAVYRPSILLVDLGLPDGSGLDLISTLSRASPRISVILGISGDAAAGDAVLRAGADAFLTKPVAGLAAFQATILRHLPDDRPPKSTVLAELLQL
ncbi:MAG: response regulator [Loktanella sp.]|nr:response regulator [Loktanella sp.]